MTLVVTVNGPETIWLLADRRLSSALGPFRDDARKVIFLDTTDRVAIIGYAGLGATAKGTEPADWISAVLRGRNLPLEQSLGVLAEAMKKEFPRHLAGMPGAIASHSMIVPAFLDDEPRLFTIDMTFAKDRRSFQFRYTRYVVAGKLTRTPRLAIGGSGAAHLQKDKHWQKRLLRLVRANDRRQVSTRAVADHLARLNLDVHRADKTFGPRYIVAWRHRKKGKTYNGCGAHAFYSGTTAEPDTFGVPAVSHGMDLEALENALLPSMQKSLATAFEEGGPEPLDVDEVNAALAALRNEPDENLR